MAHLTLTVMVATLGSFMCATAADKGLHLKSYTEDGVKGCYEHNQTFGVCFDVKKDSLKIHKTSGEGIVYYLQLDPNMFLYQVLDQSFVGHGPSMFYVPDGVPRTTDTLRRLVKDLSEDEIAQQEDLKNHYQAAMSELHYAPEVQMLERVSAALGDNTTRLDILQPFHAMCFNLLKAADVEIPDELRVAPDMEGETADQHDREKRCSRPRRRNCLGMCGRKCTCWRWVCGDCCWHRGCYEHDLCCDYNFFSSYCLAPVGITCSRFRGYPACKPKRRKWWG